MVVEELTRVPGDAVLGVHCVQKDWGPLVHYRPVLTSDSKLLVAASGSSLKVFNTTSGSLVEEHLHHDTKVVGVLPSPTREHQFVSCDASGVVCFWSPNTKEKAKTVKLNLTNEEKKNLSVVSFATCGGQEQLIVVVQYEGSAKGCLLHITAPYTSKRPSLLSADVQLGSHKVAVSSSGRYIAHISLDGLIVLGNDCSFSGRNRIRHMYGDRELTCVTFHPTQDVIATGDNTGRIVLWYNFTMTRPVKKILHWHEMPVADLVFSHTGNELYSGGGECVLVKWQLTEDRKYFLPRLGMALNHIATDTKNNYIIVTHQDNALTIISAKEYQVRGVIQGLTMTVDNAEPFFAGITYDPRTRSLILNGRTGHVQFYDPHLSRQLYHLDITMSNYYTHERYQRIHNTEVEHTAVSWDGCWLATVEFRRDFKSSHELRLKFWHFMEEDQSWYLNTSVEAPHLEYINGITFQPTSAPGRSPLFVSCADDGKFKIWEEVDTTDIYGSKSAWVCCGVGFYRHLPATTVTISPDGSLLAAGFSNILTIWVPQSCQFKGTLSQPYLKEKIEQVEFGRGEGCWSTVVTRTSHWVCAWDLFTCTLTWRVSVTSTCLAVDPLSSYMAVFSEDGDVYVFEPRSSELVDCQLNASKSKPIAAVFMPRRKKSDSCAAWNEQSNLMFLTEDQTLQMLEVGVDLRSANDKIAGRVKQLVQHSEANVTPTPFAALVAQTRTSHATQDEGGQVGTAAYGVQVEKSSALLQQVLNEARVYRLDSFATLTSEFCKMILPSAVTSEEKLARDEFDTKLKEKEAAHRKREKKLMKKKSSDLKRVAESDFSDLLNSLAL